MSIQTSKSSVPTSHQSSLLGFPRMCNCQSSMFRPNTHLTNIHSEIEDCTQEWTFASNSADYIHIRWLVGAIPDWYSFFAEAYKTCKPGGWVESFEPSSFITSDDGTVEENSALDQWGKIFNEGAKKLGVTFSVYEEELQRKAMEAAGFVDIQQFEFKVCLILDLLMKLTLW